MLNNLSTPQKQISPIHYRAMLKSEFARMMGVSMSTFRKYVKPHWKKLRNMGIDKNARLLPPKAVCYLCNVLSVDLYEDELRGR